MNKVFEIGRLTSDPETRYTQGAEPMAVTRFTMAVDRKGKKNADDINADFIRFVAFGKTAETIEKYVSKGMKLAVTGRIQTGSYNNKDGAKIYTFEVVVEDFEFCEKKAGASALAESVGFINIPEGTDEDLPFAQPTR